MNQYFLTKKLAQQIVDKTMQVIQYNINIFDINGTIIGSGEPDRLGQIHHGALMAITLNKTIHVNSKMINDLSGAKTGINMPLTLDNKIIGAIGITGEPTNIKKFAELVSVYAIMILEQITLSKESEKKAKIYEDFIYRLINTPKITTQQYEYAEQLNLDLDSPRVAVFISVYRDNINLDQAMGELKVIHEYLLEQQAGYLVINHSLTEIVAFFPAFNKFGRWSMVEHENRISALVENIKTKFNISITTAMGHYFLPNSKSNHITATYQSAYATFIIGKNNSPNLQSHYYAKEKIYILLNPLKRGWVADELANPIQKIIQQDKKNILIKTINTWFTNNFHMKITSDSLYIHRNTLEHRLRKIESITGLNLEKTEDRLLLFIALSIHEQDYIDFKAQK